VLTVMTWNVENFFIPKPADQAAYDAKVTELANVIRTAAPDLLAVQEVGDEQSFETLRSALGPSWRGCCPPTSRPRTRSGSPSRDFGWTVSRHPSRPPSMHELWISFGI
jgi:hypothetical protein